MSLSRRAFVRNLGLGAAGPSSAALIAARGREAWEAESWLSGESAAALTPPEADEIRISSNENPLGPGQKAVDAMTGEFGQAGRYPFNSRIADSDLAAAIAKKFGVKAENIVLGAGSGEVLRNAVRAFTSASKPLVTATSTFESPERTATQIKTPVKAIALDAKLALDVDAMVAASKGAGLVFFCNPNNPTATVHSAATVKDFVTRVHQASPDTIILIDEAYHEYVTDPSYATSVPLAMERPNVFVARTFSKAYGMAGLRLGYGIGQAATIKELVRYKLPYNANVFAVAGAVASLGDPAHIEQERKRNTEARKFTMDFFKGAGLEMTDSQTNFLFVKIGRPASEFREACRSNNVMVGRDFPPYEKTHARISIGTMDEMKRATEVFAKVLQTTSTSASRERG